MIRPPIVDSNKIDFGFRIGFLDVFRHVEDSLVRHRLDVGMEGEGLPDCLLHPLHELQRLVVQTVVWRPKGLSVYDVTHPWLFVEVSLQINYKQLVTKLGFWGSILPHFKRQVKRCRRVAFGEKFTVQFHQQRVKAKKLWQNCLMFAKHCCQRCFLVCFRKKIGKNVDEIDPRT